jgi:hypothetical protein
MPGTRQGKQSNKKWHKNEFNMNVNIAAINAVMAMSTPLSLIDAVAIPLANEMAARTASHTAPNDPNDAGNIDTATAVSSSTSTTLQQLFTYMSKEAQQLIEEAQLEAWEDGRSYGYEEGWVEGLQDSLRGLMEDIFEKLRKEDEVKARDNAYEEGKVHGQLEERESWMSSHGEGLCASLEESTS